MASLNKVILIGHLGDDPERKQTNAGKEFSSFRMATNEKWGEEEKTTWHTVVVWNEIKARFVNDYAKKGSLVCVEGKIENRVYEKQDGSKGYASEVAVSAYNGTVEILKDPEPREGGGGRPAATTSRPARTATPKPAKETVFEEDLDDEIPF